MVAEAEPGVAAEALAGWEGETAEHATTRRPPIAVNVRTRSRLSAADVHRGTERERVAPAVWLLDFFNLRMHAVSFHVPKEARKRLGPLRSAIDRRESLELGYLDRTDTLTQRRVRPLGLFFLGAILDPRRMV